MNGWSWRNRCLSNSDCQVDNGEGRGMNPRPEPVTNSIQLLQVVSKEKTATKAFTAKPALNIRR
jgi:hypothetical protein